MDEATTRGARVWGLAEPTEEERRARRLWRAVEDAEWQRLEEAQAEAQQGGEERATVVCKHLAPAEVCPQCIRAAVARIEDDEEGR